MTVGDAQLEAAFRAGYDRLLALSPPPLDWDDLAGDQSVLATSRAGGGWLRRLTPVAAILTGLLVVGIAVGSVALFILFSESPSPTSPSDSVPPPASTTTTLSPEPRTATPTTVVPDLTQQEAFQAILAFDPATGNPSVLAEGLEAAGAQPGLGLPVLIEQGSPEVRTVVFETLSRPSPWAVQILVSMQEFGMPSGSFEVPKPWPASLKSDIDTMLAETSEASYGPLGDMMVALNRRMVRNEVAACASAVCDWAGAWYAVPQAVANPEGTVTDSTLFEGSVGVISDTGEGSVYPITVRRFEVWVPVAGFLADGVGFLWPPGSVTCAEIEGNFPQGVDDHGLYLDQGLVSYYRAGGEDLVDEVFIQFVDDPTCTADSEAWMFMIRHLLDRESLHLSGELCGLYQGLRDLDPPPGNLDTVLAELAAAEELCN